MNLFVGVTDGDWYELLASLPALDEVNFWQPGGNTQFKALSPGELFLFKLHSPDNFIVGGGVFAASSLLPVSLAWESFGIKNGATTIVEMRSRIERSLDRRLAVHRALFKERAKGFWTTKSYLASGTLIAGLRGQSCARTR